MNDTHHLRHVLHALDGHQINAQIWQPPGESKGLIQILHGLGEYAGRYERFATAAAAEGFAVCAHDHRGHGGHDEVQGHFADRNGWNLLITDALLVLNFALDHCAKQQVILLGHSMGSFIAQSFAMRYPKAISALILSASTWPSRVQLRAATVLAQLEVWRRGASGHSPSLDKRGFGDFNKPFAPNRTASDWLSRDDVEVDKYVASPLCGGPYSAGLWRDLFGGLLEVSTSAALKKIPPEVPVLIMGGQVDPVGGERGMRGLTEHYERAGHDHVALEIYADGRHEMLNETNRDEVTADLLQWISANNN
jgi:alpha-beta hydrolase superfamily lysophospholipase